MLQGPALAATAAADILVCAAGGVGGGREPAVFGGNQQGRNAPQRSPNQLSPSSSLALDEGDTLNGGEDLGQVEQYGQPLCGEAHSHTIQIPYIYIYIYAVASLRHICCATSQGRRL